MAANALIWGMVPQRNKNFTGRTKLLSDLREIHGTRVLQGLGGVGKSAIAAEYVYRHAEDYDLVWWISSADRPELVRSSLATLAGTLGLAEAVNGGIESAATTMLAALRRGDPFARWLLIFDNADEPESLSQVIPNGPGDVLVTTRDHRWQVVADTIGVDVFAREESRQFLVKRGVQLVTPVIADQVAEKLGDLPLALEQAGALMAETGMPAADYLMMLDESLTRITAERGSSRYPLSMAAALRLTVDELQVPQASELLRCCTFFGPSPIPRDVFRRGAHAAVSPALRELLVNPILLAQAIRELRRLALVRVEGRSIVIHRLIQTVLRDELDPFEQAGYRNDVHEILAAGSPADPADPRQRASFAELAAHVGSDVVDLANCAVPGHRVVALATLRYLCLYGDLASCRTFAGQFIDGWADESDPAVLEAERRLGDVLRQLGKYPEAYEINDAALTTATRTLGPRDRRTLALRNSIGADYRALGDFRAARDLDAETSELHSELFGATDRHTLRVLSNLALDLMLTSDYQAARELYQRVFLSQSEAASGVSATEMLSTWSGLASYLRVHGDYRAARDLGEDAWGYGKESLGPEHSGTLRAANSLAISLRYLGGPLLAEATDLAGQTLGQCRRLYGEAHPDTLATTLNLASILRASGSEAEALRLGIETVARYPSVFGDDHPYHYGSIGNLAILRHANGDLDEAQRLGGVALAGLARRLGRDHLYSLTVAANLASTLAALGDEPAALDLGEDTVNRLRALLGPDHPMTLSCAANLGGRYRPQLFDFDPPAI